MAVELASAYISLIPSARGIHNQIASELKGPLNRVASDAGDSSSRAFSSRFGAGIKNSTANIARTAAVAFGGVGIALGALGGFGLKAAGDFQQTRIAFEGILGSAEKAQSFLQKLRDFAAKTPFEFPELADAAKSLLAVGFSADDVIPVMTRLGNVAATLGVGGEAINGVVRALGQMKGKGKASAEELNQISEQIPGFSAIKAIAESLGITTAEAMKKMATGAISADVAVEGILKGMEKFPGAAGAMARQSKTLNGVISTFKDSVRDALINGLEPLLPTLSSIVERAAPIIGKLVGVAAKGLASFILTIKNLGAQAADAFQVGFGGRSIAGITGWVAIVAKVGAALRGFIDFIKGDVASAGVQLGKIFGLQEDSKVVQGFIDALGSIRDAFVAVIGFIQRNWKPVLLTAAAALLVFTAPMVAVVAGLVALYFRFALVRNAVALFGTAISAIVKFLKENQTVTRILAIALGTLAAAFGALLIVGKVQAAFALFKTTLSGLGAALATNPIVLAAVALGLLAGALVVAYQHSKAFRDFIDQNFLPVFRNVTDFFKNIDWAAAFDSVSSAIKTVFAKVQDIDFASIFGRVKDVFQPVISALVPLGNAIVKLAIASIPVLVDAFAKTRTALTPVVVALYIVARVAGVVLGAALRVLAAAVSFLADHLTVLKPVLFAVAGGFAAFKLLKAVETGILGVARVAGTAFGTFQRLQGNLGRFFTTVAGGPAKLRGLAVGLRNGVVGLVSWGKAALVSARNTLKQTAAFLVQKTAAIAAAAAQKILTAAQWLLNAAMSANPIVLVVAAIAALAAGVVLAYHHFKPFRDAVDKAWQILQRLFDWVRGHWPLLLAILVAPIGLAVLAIVKNFDKIKGFISGVFNFVKQKWPTILAILTGPFGLAVLFISRNFDSIVGFFQKLPGRIAGFVSHLWDGLKNGITAAKNWVGEKISDILGFVVDLGSNISGLAQDMWGSLLSGLAAVWSGIERAFSTGVNTIIDIINGLIDAYNSIPLAPNIPKLGHVHFGETKQQKFKPPPGVFAHGGVVSKPTLALIGENAATVPEVVSPVRLMAETIRNELVNFVGRSDSSVNRIAISVSDETVRSMVNAVTDTTVSRSVDSLARTVETFLSTSESFTHVTADVPEELSVSVVFRNVKEAFGQVLDWLEHAWQALRLPPMRVPALASGGVFKTSTVAVVGEDSRTTPEIVSPVKLMADTFRQVLESTTITTSIDTKETSISADAGRATKTVRGYLIELSKMPSSVTTQVVADTKQAVRGFSEFVGAVSVSADPFQQASTQIREISNETSSIEKRFKDSTETIRKVADTTTKLTKVTQVEPITAPDTSGATSAIQSYVAALRDIPTGVVTRLVTDTQRAAVAVSDFVTAVSVSPVPFEQASVHIRDISRETSTVDEQLKRSTRTIRDVVNTSTDLTTVLSTPPTQPSFTVPTAAEVAAPDAVKASSAVRDYVVELAKIPTSVVTKLLVDSDRAKVSGTDQFEAFVKTVLPSKNVLSVANQFTTATSTVDKASTSFVHSLEQFPKTVLNVQRPEPVKPQTESGKFDLTVKPTAPIVTPAAQLAPTFQTNLTTTQPKSPVTINSEVHVDKQSFVEEIDAANKKLGMRVAIAGRR